MRDFTGKVAVVTGGAAGIGRAIALRLAREGARVVVADVEEPALQRTVDELKSVGADAMGVVTDVTKFDSVRELERRATAAYGNVHVLCNNAGVGAQEDVPLWELPLSDWAWTLQVNLWGVIHGLKAFLPGMLAHGEAGHVVNTSSGNGGLILVPGTPIYSASKAAVSALTETLHLQLTAQGAKIRASVLYPGPHMVASRIFDARRNRLPEFAREVPQATPPITLDVLRQMAKSAGVELQTTEPEEVAEHFLDGLRREAYAILPMTPELEERIRTRTENLLQGRDPQVV